MGGTESAISLASQSSGSMVWREFTEASPYHLPQKKHTTGVHEGRPVLHPSHLRPPLTFSASLQLAVFGPKSVHASHTLL